jgi:hypothetical protein
VVRRGRSRRLGDRGAARRVPRARTNRVRPKPEKDEDDGKPSAFVEVYGRLEVDGSIATIHPHEPAA